MEIRIKTHEEFRADRVTIEITGTGAEVRRYTDGQVANLQASEAELVAGPLRARINELEAELSRRASVIKKLENKVEGYDTDRHTERDRADRERQRASELKDRLSTSEERVAELENQVGALTRRIDNARIILEDPQVTEIRDEVMARKSVRLADAIGKALDTLTWH